MNWENMNGKKWRTCKRLPVLCHLKLCFITLCALIRLSIYFLLVGLFLIFAPPAAIHGIISGKVPLFQSLIPLCFLGYLSFRYWKRVFRRCKPGGTLLDPERFGALYDDVRAICRDLKISPIRQIYLDAGVDIRVMPRFPAFKSRQRNILLIGYPLVCTMDAKSFRICLTRVLCHENRRIARNATLRRIRGLWALLPWESILGDDDEELESAGPPGIDTALFPLEVRAEFAADQWCAETFGRQDFAACVTQAYFRLERFNAKKLARTRFSKTAPDANHAAAVIRDEIRKAVPEPEAKRILEKQLRVSEELFEKLPPFRERVGTDDPAALLPYLERTPDAAEHYLFSDPAFEAEYNGILKKALLRRKKEEEFLVEIGEDDPEDDDELAEDDTNEEDENTGEETR
jgi:hypothetical protein